MIIWFEGLLLLILFILVSRKLYPAWLTLTMGKKAKEDSEDFNTNYIASIIHFFRTKSDDKLAAAESTLLLQQQIAKKLAKRSLLIGIYVFVMITFLKTIMGNKVVISLPYLGSFGWGKALIFIVVLQWFLKKLWKVYWSVYQE